MKEIALRFYKSKMVKILIFSTMTFLIIGCSNSNLEKKEINVEINGPSQYPMDIRENIKKTLNEQSK